MDRQRIKHGLLAQLRHVSTKAGCQEQDLREIVEEYLKSIKVSAKVVITHDTDGAYNVIVKLSPGDFTFQVRLRRATRTLHPGDCTQADTPCAI